MEETREREETEEGGGEMFTQAPGADASANVAETPAPEGTATSHETPQSREQNPHQRPAATSTSTPGPGAGIYTARSTRGNYEKADGADPRCHQLPR